MKMVFEVVEEVAKGGTYNGENYDEGENELTSKQALID